MQETGDRRQEDRGQEDRGEASRVDEKLDDLSTQLASKEMIEFEEGDLLKKQKEQNNNVILQTNKDIL